MQDKEETVTKDSLLVEYLANILDDFYKEDEAQKKDISTIKYLFKNGYLPPEYHFRDMMRVFSVEYSIIDKTELDILNLKNKWVNRIMENTYLKVDIIDSNYTDDNPQNIFLILEDIIEHLNEVGVGIVQKNFLKLFDNETKIMEVIDISFYNDNPNFKRILVCIYKFKIELFNYILNKLNENVFKPTFLKNLDNTIVSETLLSERGVYEKRYGFVPTLKGFGMYLISKMEQINVEEFKMDVGVFLTDYVIDKLEIIDINIEKAKNKKQTLIESTPHQTLSIETTTATEEENNLVLSQREIALIYHYEDWLLTDANCNDEVSKYFKKDGTRHTSGKALMADYRIVHGRIKDWLNQKNTIQYLEKVIPLLKNATGINDAKGDLEQAIKNRESLF